jgi:NAD+ diphosphatase
MRASRENGVSTTIERRAAGVGERSRRRHGSAEPEQHGRGFHPRIRAMVMVTIAPARGARRCLLVRPRGRPAEDFRPLTGRVRVGESLEEAVQREVREATGLEVEQVAFEASRAWRDPASLVVGFRARTTGSPGPAASASRELRWFTQAEVRELLGATAPAPDAPDVEPLDVVLLRDWVWNAR